MVNIAVDDLGASAVKKYDCEAWIPSQDRYREVDLDLQHDRLPVAAARHPLPALGGRRRATCATLNGTAVTWRHLIALLENGQREDGSVEVPEVLHAVGCAGGAAGRGQGMTETPDIAPEAPDVPDERPPADDSTPEVEDQPLGPPADLPDEDAPLPGIPENEPPASE